MPSYGIGVKKKSKSDMTSTGYTEGQVKAQKKASPVRAIGIIAKRRKEMEEILGK